MQRCNPRTSRAEQAGVMQPRAEWSKGRQGGLKHPLGPIPTPTKPPPFQKLALAAAAVEAAMWVPSAAAALLPRVQLPLGPHAAADVLPLCHYVPGQRRATTHPFGHI